MNNENFAKSYDWITRAKNLTPTQKLIINQVLRFDDTDYKCIQSYPKMAEALGLSLSPVKKNLSILRKLGIILADIKPFIGHKLTIDIAVLRDFITTESLKSIEPSPNEESVEPSQDYTEPETDNESDKWSALILDEGLPFKSRFVKDVLEMLKDEELQPNKENFLRYYSSRVEPIITIR